MHGGDNRIYGLRMITQRTVCKCEVLDNFRGLCGPRTRTRTRTRICKLFLEDNNTAMIQSVGWVIWSQASCERVLLGLIERIKGFDHQRTEQTANASLLTSWREVSSLELGHEAFQTRVELKCQQQVQHFHCSTDKHPHKHTGINSRYVARNGHGGNCPHKLPYYLTYFC